MTTMHERFWAKVVVGRVDGCWQWTGAGLSAKGKGYGLFAGTVAHRWLYQRVIGEELSREITLDHLCRNRGCVNPNHLEPVTSRINVLRGIGRSAENARKTHCPQGHLLNGDNLYRLGTRRHCRACRAERDRARKLIIHGGRPHSKDRTHCPQGHPYEGDNLYIVPSNGHRMCRACDRAKHERRWAAKSKGLGLPALRTHCPQGHEYTKANTYVNPSGERNCRTCRNERQRIARAEGRWKR